MYTLHQMNDTAGRCILFIADYNEIFTKNKNQNNFYYRLVINKCRIPNENVLCLSIYLIFFPFLFGP